MSTINQLIRGARVIKRKTLKYKDLFSRMNTINNKLFIVSRGNPQRSGICTKVGKKTPKKPNSALRSWARVSINGGRNEISAYIPGIGHNVQQYSKVLFSPSGPKDLPGVKYSLIRSWTKGDLKGPVDRKTSRSRYGVKKDKK